MEDTEKLIWDQGLSSKGLYLAFPLSCCSLTLFLFAFIRCLFSHLELLMQVRAGGSAFFAGIGQTEVYSSP